MQVKKQKLEPDIKQWTGSKLGKEYIKAVYCHPAYLTYMQSIMRDAELNEAQAGIKIARRYINNLRYASNTTLMTGSKEELKSFLMRVKEKSEKASLKPNIQKTKITASGPITSWQIYVKNWKEWQTLFSVLQNHGGHWLEPKIKRCLLLGRKAMTNLASILKSRDIALVFPVVMYRCGSWTTQKAEHWQTDAFKLLEKTLESPVDCKEIQPVHPKGNQSWIVIGRTDWSSNTLASWCEEPTHWERP